MMKNLLLVIALIFSLHAEAQRRQSDALFLKSGAIISGTLTSIDDQTIRIKTGHNLLVFPMSEIDSIGNYSPRLMTRRNHTRTDENFPAYYFSLQAGLLAGSSQNEKSAPFSFQASFNHELSYNLYAGAGVGVEFLSESYLPVFAQAGYGFRSSGFTPFVEIQGGYLVAMDNTSRYVYSGYYPVWSSAWYPYYQRKVSPDGGWFVNPSFGFRTMVNPHLGWSFTFGYRFHRLKYSGDDEYRLESDFNRLSLKVGILFN